jgi:hypothetical protein
MRQKEVAWMGHPGWLGKVIGFPGLKIETWGTQNFWLVEISKFAVQESSESEVR